MRKQKRVRTYVNLWSCANTYGVRGYVKKMKSKTAVPTLLKKRGRGSWWASPFPVYLRLLSHSLFIPDVCSAALWGASSLATCHCSSCKRCFASRVALARPPRAIPPLLRFALHLSAEFALRLCYRASPVGGHLDSGYLLFPCQVKSRVTPPWGARPRT